MPQLQVIVPVYNEEECLPVLMQRLLKVRESLPGVDVGFIFVNDGSTDRSMAHLVSFARQPFVTVLEFSRNFGHQIAITAGLDHATADHVAIIDSDLQDPPELIPTMYTKAKEGYQVVYGKRASRKGETFFKRLTAAAFYRLMSKLCSVEIPVDTGDFRLVSREVVMELQRLREHHRFVRGLVPWVGYTSIGVEYERDERYAGETKYPLRKMIAFAKDAIFSFSRTPLVIANFIGYFIVAAGAIGSLFILYLKFVVHWAVPGITAVILTVIILGGIQIIMLGIIGEYIGRIFEETKNRPLYIVKKKYSVHAHEGSAPEHVIHTPTTHV